MQVDGEFMTMEDMIDVKFPKPLALISWGMATHRNLDLHPLPRPRREGIVRYTATRPWLRRPDYNPITLYKNCPVDFLA